MDSAGCCGFSPPCQEVGQWRLPASSPCSPCCPQTCGRSCCGSDPSLPSQLTASLVAGPDQRSAADHHHSRSNLGFPSLSVAFSYFQQLSMASMTAVESTHPRPFLHLAFTLSLPNAIY